MDANTTPGISRISYRFTPSGLHKYRIIPVRPLRRSSAGSLVYSNEVAEMEKQSAISRVRAGFGGLPKRTVFTKLAKEKVRDGCAILDSTFGKRVVFATGTLPGSTKESFSALASWSGYLVKRLKAYLAYKYPSVKVVWVWEFQKRGALHLHAAFGSDNDAQLHELKGEWHRIWCNNLAKISQKSCVDVFDRGDGYSYSDKWHLVRTDAQFVEKSVSRYLSKYLSKKASANKEEMFFCPSRWWGIDNSIRSLIKEQTICTLSPLYTWTKAKQIYDVCTVELSLIAEKFFAWKNKFNPLERAFICWLPDPAPA